MATLREVRASLVEVSRRYSRVTHEVEDLAHDIILSALRRKATLDVEVLLRNAHAAARQHAAFLARSALRRRAREAASASEPRGDVEPEALHDVPEGAPLSELSPVLRTTLLLLLTGLDKAELRAVLGVTDAALRKRFQSLKESAPLARPRVVLPERTPALAQLRRSQIGVLPRLSARLDSHPGPRVLAASDPDGHGIIFTEVLTPGRRTATSRACSASDRTRRKGNPC